MKKTLRFDIITLFLFSLTTLLIGTKSIAQSRVSIKSPDSLAFQLTIQETEVNSWPCISTTFDYPQSGKINFAIKFPGHPELNFSQLITLKKNYAHFYEVEKSKGAMKLMLKSESLLESVLPSNASAIPKDISAETKSATGVADSTAQESGGCGLPADEISYQKMLNDVKESYFETRKLETMKQFLMNSCVSVEQIRFMMTRLSMEDNKIELLKQANGHISDPKNIKKVEEDFFLQKNKALVQELAGKIQSSMQ